MTDTEFLEMCRLAAGHDTGGQWTDEKADAIEALASDPRGAVRRLLALYNAAAQEVERLQAAWSAEHDAYIRADEQARMAKREAERLRDEIEDIRYAAWEESMGEDL